MDVMLMKRFPEALMITCCHLRNSVKECLATRTVV